MPDIGHRPFKATSNSFHCLQSQPLVYGIKCHALGLQPSSKECLFCCYCIFSPQNKGKLLGIYDTPVKAGRRHLACGTTGSRLEAGTSLPISPLSQDGPSSPQSLWLDEQGSTCPREKNVYFLLNWYFYGLQKNSLR